jgi:hypothetical protein
VEDPDARLHDPLDRGAPPSVGRVHGFAAGDAASWIALAVLCLGGQRAPAGPGGALHGASANRRGGWTCSTNAG